MGDRESRALTYINRVRERRRHRLAWAVTALEVILWLYVVVSLIDLRGLI